MPPPRLCFGAQITADADSGWLQQLQRFTFHILFWLKNTVSKLFETVLKLFCFSFISLWVWLYSA